MSQELLAAFGDFSAQEAKPAPSANAPSYSFFDDFRDNNNNNVLNPATVVDRTSNQSSAPSTRATGYQDDATTQDNEDDWGDFEGTAEEPKPAVTPLPVASQFSRWLDDEDDGFPDYDSRNAAKNSKGKWDFTKPDQPVSSAGRDFQQTRPAPPKLQPQPRDPNVLFDAADEPLDEDDDDFGDFEDADVAPKNASLDIADLLGMDKPVPLPSQNNIPVVQAPAATSFLLDLGDLDLDGEATNVWRTDNRPSTHGFGTLGPLSRPKSPTKSAPLKKVSRQDTLAKATSHASPIKSKPLPTKSTPKPSIPSQEEEKWDDFEAWEQGADVVEPSQPVSTVSTTSIAIPPTLTSETSESSLSSPPTNIPPPALILSLFSPLFNSAETSFFRPLRQESQEVQQAIYSEHAAVMYLKGMLALATVCGRVIAGRKQRWKRDTILAQSMRIGPSAAGGVSGLKLTSIDKAENSREEREVADVLKAWQGQVGKLKSAIAEVKRLTGKEIGKIPELRDTIPVRVAKEIEGGLKGYRPCALCGLKREERVLKVDYELEDSFGEWWVDNVSMHRACRNFWEQHRESLRQR